MNGKTLRIDVLMCTFRRPGVGDTLASLEAQDLPQGVSLRIIVADNDETPTGRAAVEAAAAGMTAEVVYIHAPARNISVARNAGLAAASRGGAAWVAFIDDDETAAPDWIAALLSCQAETGADGVFGPAVAVYAPDAPDWMREQDHHSNIPEARGGTVATGHSCNGFLRWQGTPWQAERFDPGRGRTGGEDTEFFFRLHRMGARYAIAGEARVFEPVEAKRLTFEWIRQRKFRMGQSYASSATGIVSRVALFGTAALKAAWCQLRAGLSFGNEGGRRFWALRGAMHRGVCAGCLSMDEAQIYGN